MQTKQPEVMALQVQYHGLDVGGLTAQIRKHGDSIVTHATCIELQHSGTIIYLSVHSRLWYRLLWHDEPGQRALARSHIGLQCHGIDHRGHSAPHSD